MKVAVAFLLITFAVFTAADVLSILPKVEVFTPEGSYLTTHDNIDIDAIFKDEALLRTYVDCFKGLPCSHLRARFVSGTYFFLNLNK